MKRIVTAIVLLAAVLMTACAPPPGRLIHIDAPPEFIQNGNWEFTRLMSEIGYKHLDILSPLTGQPVEVVIEHGEYRMLFAAIDDPTLRVSVRFGFNETEAKIDFYREGQKGLDVKASARYKALVDRVVEEFGQEHVDFD